MSAFEHVVRACDGGTLVVIDMKRCNPASRAWWDWGRGKEGEGGGYARGRLRWVRARGFSKQGMVGWRAGK